MSRKLMICLVASVVMLSPLSLNILQMCFLIFSVSLGIASDTASPSSLYNPIFMPRWLWSWDNR